MRSSDEGSSKRSGVVGWGVERRSGERRERCDCPAKKFAETLEAVGSQAH